jgi:NAD+ diphosphatase
MERRFVSAVAFPEQDDATPAWWFIFRGNEIVIRDQADDPMTVVPLLPLRSDTRAHGLHVVRRHFLGHLAGTPCIAAEISPDVPLPPEFTCCGLRAIYGRVSDDLFVVAGRAAQIIEWDRTHQYCGRCGTPTEIAPAERAKQCPRCGMLSFPRLSPAIIVLVERGDEILLARSPHFAEGMYSTLAGFVEPGESLEEAVYREVLEEAGIAVSGLQYFGSQPWPFPHSLMIGFTAHYAGGEITIDGNEIEDARWFTAYTLPRVPQKLSIARRLIDAFVARYREPLDQP